MVLKDPDFTPEFSKGLYFIIFFYHPFTLNNMFIVIIE